MRRKTAWVILASTLVLAGSVASVYSLYGESSQYASQVARATGYLAANYNPSIGMVSETPKGSTYFVYSDNFLAAYVLGGSRNSTLRSIATNITSTDKRFLAKVPHPTNQYQVISSSNGTFFASNNYVLSRIGSSVIETTLNNGTSPLSPARYADIAFLDALYFHQIGAKAFAISDFAWGAKLYDGRGFDDQAFCCGQYQTYKLALYDYVGKILGVVLPPGLDASLARLQAPNGGFYTGYVADFAPVGSTNTETTSLAILALNTPTVKTAQQYLPVFVSAVAAIVLVEAVVMKGWSERRQKATEDALRFS
jgi:hypothetical protein